jgi:hypothetical protein
MVGGSRRKDATRRYQLRGEPNQGGLASACAPGHSLFERAEATDEGCWARIERRNPERPEGLFYGEVSRALFEQVTRYFVPPAPEEGFHGVRHPQP